ncbi:type IV toxin-antitoxin system AbiEi family antitoxin domain-containing protein [Candidatus Neptunochlamydia vexilliferae]|uniref:AbiEi antitoxin N-terminal domain-containing protein n=1 Tax=Candidatus Neptunichlamydia vexilliferae TaxID=1651774 RepID=A0ABS0AWN3_9BACT|nr:type IV toxin-antitoxin system AbiEi family antitoxin domain-containing protein [Candidatus Neptunochlamydia vexilliferae]MBF5058535.1 hypothetical protein [Candidatus Neptunochlamydia vexilliferae]
MKKSKYLKAFAALAKKPVFSAKDGRKVGIPARMLSYFCSKGWIERVGRGVYKVKDVEITQTIEWEDLAVTAMSIPDGVICLISALCYYDLTDEIMREFWIAIPHPTTSPKRENTRIVRMRNITIGQTTVKIGKQKVRIFDRERTIIDSFRYLDKEISLKALQVYLRADKSFKPNIKKLIEYARLFRVNITPYIMAMTV